MGRERRQNYTPTACKHTGACQCKFSLRENAYFWLSLILVFVPNPFRRHLIWRTTWGLLALGYIRPNPSWVWQRNCTFLHHICKSLASFGTFVLPIVPGFWRLYSLPFYPLCTCTTREAWECISIPRVDQREWMTPSQSGAVFSKLCSIGTIQCSHLGLQNLFLASHLKNCCEVLSQPFVGNTRGLCWTLDKPSRAKM